MQCELLTVNLLATSIRNSMVQSTCIMRLECWVPILEIVLWTDRMNLSQAAGIIHDVITGWKVLY